MRDLPQLNEKNKERPLCFPYSIKARAHLHAHFSRIALPQETLLKGTKSILSFIVYKCKIESTTFDEIIFLSFFLFSDLELILKNSPTLVREMINIVGQLMYFAKHGRGNYRIISCHVTLHSVIRVVVILWSN